MMFERINQYHQLYEIHQNKMVMYIHNVVSNVQQNVLKLELIDQAKNEM